MALAPDAPLDELLTVRSGAPGAFTAQVPDGWQQGRGTFGGLVVGLLIRAAEAGADTGGEPRALRSLTAELVGPTLPGEAAFTVEVLRAGSAVTTVAVRLAQAGEVRAHAVAVLGRPRSSDHDGVFLAAPTPTDWREVEPLAAPEGMVPAFAKFWEFRNVGLLPFCGQAGTVSGWTRPRRPGPTRDAAFLGVCIDAWWPALLTSEASPRPVGTVGFTMQVLLPPDTLPPDAPLFHRATTVAAFEGYSVELRELWTPDGRLAALNQQTIALIK